jgi:hypothetical protein
LVSPGGRRKAPLTYARKLISLIIQHDMLIDT